MRRGAADYLIKDRLSRLGKAVENALSESRLRKQQAAMIQKLKENEERLAAAQELARFGSWVFNYATKVLTWSDGLYLIFRRDRNLPPPTVAEIRSWVHTDDLGIYDADFIRSVELEEKSQSEYRIRRHDGQTIWVDVRTTVIRDAGGKPTSLTGTTQDITDRKLQEAALSESEARFRQIAENIEEVIWMMDPINNESLYISPQYEQLWGRSCASHEEDPSMWVSSIHPDDRERVILAVQTRRIQGEYDEVYRIVRPDGSMRWIRDRAFPIRNREGQIYRLVGTAIDITEQRKLEEQLLRAQRLEAIGNLSTGIAHDLNNILAPTLMVTSILREKLQDPHDVELLALVEQGAQRGAGIVRQLLTFSRGVTGSRGVVYSNHILREMVDIMRETFPKDIQIIEQVPADLSPILADSTQIHQVVMNLCVNARDAMPNGGRLSLGAENAFINDEEAGMYPPSKAGNYVVFSVTDTGEGIPSESLDKIFEPFFTTLNNLAAKGTGLGLSTVTRELCEATERFVTVTSKVASGSTFRVHIPAAESPAVAPLPVSAPELPRGQGQRVLIVDDESPICLAAARTLERQNYRVLTATNGQDALAVFLQAESDVELLMTDLMMPHMGGLALIRTLRSLNPSIKVLATTGLDEKAESRDELVSLNVFDISLQAL